MNVYNSGSEKRNGISSNNTNSENGRSAVIFENGSAKGNFTGWYEMLENENHEALGRLHDLERKVLEQRDELICLKATLAEALRRISILEGCRLPHQVQQVASTPPTTPVRNGIVKEQLRLRQTGISSTKKKIEARELNSKSYGSSLPQRRAARYQSTGSLHSDSHSSSSISPVPPPSPRATPLPLNVRQQHQQQQQQQRPPIVHNSHPPLSPSSGGLHKRWSSTGDFNNSSALSPQSNTKEATYNEEDQAVRIYLRGRPIVLYAPSEIGEHYDLTKVATAPHQKPKLNWVYGYRGRDCRSNLHFLPTGEMVYFVAAVVVLYDAEEQNQRHYLGHTDDVKSLAIHPKKLLVATGQCAGHEGRAHIRVWNSVSLTTVAVVGMNDFDVSVCCLSFSKSDGGSLLVAIDEAPDHTISVWDWQKGENGYKITETKCSVDTVVAAEFHPLDRNTIVTCGRSHLAFWTLDVGGTLYKRMGIFENRDKPKYVLCISFMQTGEVITGDSNGNLIVWGRGTNTIVRIVKNVHEGSVFSICVLRDGGLITGGGRDARLVFFDPDLNKNGDVCQIEEHFGGIRMISEGRGSQLLIGTTRNCILMGSADLGFQPIVLGHTDELWGLAAHPTVPQFATAGQDKLLQMWDSMSHSILWSKEIDEAAQSLAFSADGNIILVGCMSGSWFVYDSQTRELLSHHVDGNEPIQVIRFSPDGGNVALGSRDNHIYIYEISDDGRRFRRVGVCSGHSSFITHLDWSSDGQFIRSNSGDYELLFWNSGTCRQITQSTTLRDVEWASNTCTLTFTTIGIWPENADGTDVNCCDRNQEGNLMVTGDDFGKIKLYTYPVTQPKSLNNPHGGHSSHVTNVSFLHDNSRFVSTGGKDTSVMQWVLV
ncbi:echinoderm microtubule-associated protein-like 2 isoform X3 [Agrilus planipennis]|uniref:Echinoderm microtubule-associated protein-like 2 isoform X3 n=1 Tax=Agrilus planipennis TaxID=224129 RepID=A0A1W4WPH5_AGRPL|nr:echinoderm microtubule-associated protein-like 2 isoform X3 [Agrilus planipennis]